MATAPPRMQQFTSILLLTALLVTVLTMRTQCANGAARIFEVTSTPGARPQGTAPFAR
jgi:hypothetical protein